MGKGEWRASCPDRFTSWEAASVTQSTGAWLGPKAGIDALADKEICTVIVWNVRHLFYLLAHLIC